MSGGTGGWVLELRCTGCDATEMFRGVVPSLAGDRAKAAGWSVETTPRVLAMKPGKREELCPKCVIELAG